MNGKTFVIGTVILNELPHISRPQSPTPALVTAVLLPVVEIDNKTQMIREKNW